MIIVSKLKLAFMHVPKTGGSSITAALMPYLGQPNGPTSGNGWQIPHHMQGYDMHSAFFHYKWEKPDDEWRTFAVVREPFDRMHSYYTNNKKPGQSFVEWLKESAESNVLRHRMSQFNLIQKDGQVGVDVVIPFENLSEGLATLGIQLPEKRINVGNRTREQMLAAYERSRKLLT
jgi:hypothetical protein